MYAAAGGASLASRQARQRQRQQKKTQQLQAKLHPPKAPGVSITEHGGTATPTRQSQSRQFHQLSTNYLRAPHTQVRKLSASYTTQSKTLLPIDEGDTRSLLHMRMHSHSHTTHAHSHAHQPQQQQPIQQQHHHQHIVLPPAADAQHKRSQRGKHEHRYSGDNNITYEETHLPKSATATLPLASQVDSPQASKEKQALVIDDRVAPTAAPTAAAAAADDDDDDGVQQQTGILSPSTSPAAAPASASQLPAPTETLQRKCSVYRMKHNEDYYTVRRHRKDFDFQQQYEPLLPINDGQIIFKGFPRSDGMRKMHKCVYCEEGICACEHIECAQGRAAWLERSRRCSVQDNQQSAQDQARWMQDSSQAGSSDDEDFLSVLRGPSTFANSFLYVGLGTIALGLVIAFVGTGEKGFKTVELRLIGPSLIGIGFVCCCLRILFCICPSHCLATNKNVRKINGNKFDADHTTSLLHDESKRLASTRRTAQKRQYPFVHKHTNNKMFNEGMEALRHIATTSLFMQNEQKPLTNRIVPIIKEPATVNVNTLENLKLNKASSSIQVVSCKSKPIKDTQIQISEHQQQQLRTKDAEASKLTAEDNTIGNVSLDETRYSKSPESFLYKSSQTSTNFTTPTFATNNSSITTSTINDKRTIPDIDSRQSPQRPFENRTVLDRNENPSSLTQHLINQQTDTDTNTTTAISIANTFRSNKEPNDCLVRGPLGMPMHILTGLMSAYNLENSPTTSSNILGKTKVNTFFVPTTTTLTRTVTTTAATLSTILKQEQQPVVSGQNLITNILPNSILDDQITAIRSETISSNSTDSKDANDVKVINFFNSPTSISRDNIALTNSQAQSQVLAVSSTTITNVTTATTIVNKFEQELLLSPANLAR